jgi:DNA-directed RNA polymerase specialized sigma24 family protein
MGTGGKRRGCIWPRGMEGCVWRRWCAKLGGKDQAAAQAVKRFGQKLSDDLERKGFLADLKRQLSTLETPLPSGNIHAAEDLTQEFLIRLIQTNAFARADRNKGRFRSWLLGALNHFLAHEWEKARAQKRGGGSTWIGVAEAEGNARFQRHLSTETVPEKLYDQQSALTIIGRAATRLRATYVADGRPEIYDHLKKFVSGAGTQPSYAEAAAQIEMSEAAVKSAVHR